MQKAGSPDVRTDLPFRASPRSGLLGIRPGSDRRFKARLHSGFAGPRHSSACSPDDSRDGDGVGFCNRRRVLGVEARSGCSRDGWHHRVNVGDCLRNFAGSIDVRGCDGGSPDRRAKSRPSRGERGTGSRRWSVGRAGGGGDRSPACAPASSIDGRVAAVGRQRTPIHVRDVGQQLRDSPTFPNQCDFSRRRRRGDCDAGAVVGEPDQPGPGPLLDIRLGPVSSPGCNRCRSGHHHWPQRGSHFSIGDAGSRPKPDRRPARAPPTSSDRHAPSAAPFCKRNPSSRDRHRQLAWTGEDSFEVRQQCARRVHDRGSDHSLCPAPLVGNE